MNNQLLLITNNYNSALILNSVITQNNTPPAILTNSISPQEAPLI